MDVTTREPSLSMPLRTRTHIMHISLRKRKSSLAFDVCQFQANLVQEQWIGYVLVCCFGVVFTIITQGQPCDLDATVVTVASLLVFMLSCQILI